MCAIFAVIDSYDLIRVAFSQQLQKMGFEVIIEAKNGDDFMQQIGSVVPGFCLLDIDTPTIHQYTTARRIKQQYPSMNILAYTLFERNYTKVEEYGIDLFLPKNISLQQLKAKILELAS
ncbi:MAG: response regulator [Bacteroidetes bacterium]|nr:response regulator [Bacteroidota bacterium]